MTALEQLLLDKDNYIEYLQEQVRQLEHALDTELTHVETLEKKLDEEIARCKKYRNLLDMCVCLEEQ